MLHFKLNFICLLGYSFLRCLFYYLIAKNTPECFQMPSLLSSSLLIATPIRSSILVFHCQRTPPKRTDLLMYLSRSHEVSCFLRRMFSFCNLELIQKTQFRANSKQPSKQGHNSESCFISHLDITYTSFNCAFWLCLSDLSLAPEETLRWKVATLKTKVRMLRSSWFTSQFYTKLINTK